MQVALGVLAILIGLAMAIWGGRQGVTVTAPSPGGGTRSGKVYGTGALVIGLIVIGYGIYALVKGLTA